MKNDFYVNLILKSVNDILLRKYHQNKVDDTIAEIKDVLASKMEFYFSEKRVIPEKNDITFIIAGSMESTNVDLDVAEFLNTVYYYDEVYKLTLYKNKESGLIRVTDATRNNNKEEFKEFDLSIKYPNLQQEVNNKMDDELELKLNKLDKK